VVERVYLDQVLAKLPVGSAAFAGDRKDFPEPDAAGFGLSVVK
jgi:hypothetical protein